MAGGVGYSGVGEPSGYGSYGTGGYNPYMLPYAGGTGQTGQTGTGTGQTGTGGATGTGGTGIDYTTAGPTPMAQGGKVPKMQAGGEVPTKTVQRMSSIAEMLKTLRES